MAAPDIQWWINKSLHKACYEIHGRIPAGPKQLLVLVQPMTLKAFDSVEEKEAEQDGYSLPAMSLTKESVQSLMDELWACGVRPSNGDGNFGQLAATKAHLEDMRKMVFELMDLKK